MGRRPFPPRSRPRAPRWPWGGSAPARSSGEAPELSHLLFQGSHPLDELRQHGLGHPDPAGLGGRPRRVAGPDLARRDVAGHPRLRHQDRPFADGDVVGHADLSGQHGPAADLARARHAHLADQDLLLTDIAVVAYLHEVVDLRAAPHDGRAHGGAVDGGVRSDLDIVLDDEPSHLRDLLVGGSVERIAESVGAQHGAGMDDDAITEAYPVSHHDPRVQPHVGAEHGPPPDIAEGAHGGARPDHGAARLGEPAERVGAHSLYFLAFRISSSKTLMISSVTSASGAPKMRPP